MSCSWSQKNIIWLSKYQGCTLFSMCSLTEPGDSWSTQICQCLHRNRRRYSCSCAFYWVDVTRQRHEVGQNHLPGWNLKGELRKVETVSIREPAEHVYCMTLQQYWNANGCWLCTGRSLISQDLVHNKLRPFSCHLCGGFLLPILVKA